MKGMVLQGRRGAVITALDIVSPTSNYVESSRDEASQQTELHLCCWSPPSQHPAGYSQPYI